MMRELGRMNLGTFGLGLPALAGVALGLRLYTGGREWCVVAALSLGVLWAIMAAGRFMLTTYPRAGAWIIDSWILSAVIVTAFITDLIVSLSLSDWFPQVLGSADTKPLEKLSATLVGAVATFAAVVWTNDIADARGYFWPSTQFKYGLKALYDRLAAKPTVDDAAYGAVFLDYVPNTDVTGWAFADRHIRAGIVADYLKAHP